MYCRACGELKDHDEGSCLSEDTIRDMVFDSVIEAFCPECGAEREVEPDARNYECWEDDCSGKITSPLEFILF